jgi:hypothetical protein
MPHSGIAFVSRVRGSQDAPVHKVQLQESSVMCIERLVRNFGFGLAAVVVVLGLSATIEYQPVINALAR